MLKVFISYRRSDSAYVSNVIYKYLSEHLGADNVFIDVDKIPAGVDFRQYLAKAVNRCDVLITVIGDQWQAVCDEHGCPRIEDPEDYVRVEIESALASDTIVLPVLVGDARMPAAKQLPESLKQLAYRNAAEVRAGRSMDDHLKRLLDDIQSLAILKGEPPVQQAAAVSAQGRSVSGRGVLVVLAVLILAGVLWSYSTLFNGTSADQRPMPLKPRILMVTPDAPSGHFGVLHKEGLRNGLARTRFGSPIVFGGHSDEFKAGGLERQLAALQKELKKVDVLAVVAPSITEAAEEVLDMVAATEPSVPVIIESSVPWEDLSRFRQMSLFRLSSGIDERSREIASIASDMTQNGMDVWLLVEEVAGESSYGGRLHDHIRRLNNDQIIKSANIVHFSHGDPSSQLSKVPFEDANAVVMVLALGSDFERIIKARYQQGSSTAARLVGVMVAYKLPGLLGGGEFKNSLIFDLSDLDIRREGDDAGAADPFYQDYAARYGRIVPSHRDQAFSFDVGRLLDAAYTPDLTKMYYLEGVHRFAKQLAQAQIQGVTGRITFRNPPGMNNAWQNEHTVLRMATYDAESSLHSRPLVADDEESELWKSVDWRLWKPK